MAKTHGSGLLMRWTDMRLDAGSPVVYQRINPGLGPAPGPVALHADGALFIGGNKTFVVEEKVII